MFCKCELTFSQSTTRLPAPYTHEAFIVSGEPTDTTDLDRNRQLVTAAKVTPPPDEPAQTLAKANEAIAIRPKRGRLTLLSRRIYNALLYHSQQQGVDQPVYSLPLVELIGDARFNSNNTELLKSHLRDMQATTIEWSTSGVGQNRWVSTQLIGTVTIEEPGKGRPCHITWRFPEEIRERLVKPARYTRILLEISAMMRSYAAAVLYEIGARYLTSPSRLTMREDTIWWAAVLTGRSDITEVDYRFLKRDVISKALAEVDTYCDEFSLELVEHKRGRKVEDMQFRVVPKMQQALLGGDPTQNVFDLELVGRLIALGIPKTDAQDLYATTDEGQLRATLEHTEQRLKNQALPELKSPVAYFRDALRKGYAATPELPERRSRPKPAPARKPSKEDQLQWIRDAWEADRAARASEYYRELGEDPQGQLRHRFEIEQLPELATPIVRAWQRDGPNSRIARGSFFRWVANVTWPEELTDSKLLDFAISKGLLKSQ